jgi:hypothetical protein
MMKLWLLLQLDEGSERPCYDCALGFVVRAETEEEARAHAAADCGDEGPEAWTKKAHCAPLTAKGESGVILRDFNAG